MDLLLRLMVQIILVFQSIVTFFKGIFRGKGKHVSECEDPILKISAVALAEKIRRKEIRSEDVLRAYVKRIKDVNGLINAIVEDRFSEALDDARKVDEIVKNEKPEDLELKRPLLGVPVTIKECLSVKGMSYTGCSINRKGVKAERDGRVVELLKRAGAIPLLVSTTPEYCTAYDTANDLTGRTRNPYNTLHTSGGSSGGEGALLGAGASLIGIGSDLGGSIRVPASFNCVFGHKPTANVVSTDGHLPSFEKVAEWLTVGPMTRYAEDLNLILKIISDKQASKLRLDEDVNLTNVRVLFMENCGNEFGLVKVAAEVKIAIKEAVMHLSRNFHCAVYNKIIKEFENTFEIVNAVLFTTGPWTESKDKFNFFVELIKSIFGKSQFHLYTLLCMMYAKVTLLVFKNYSKYTPELQKLKEVLMSELGNDGVLIYPGYPTPAFKKHAIMAAWTAGGAYMTIFNLLGFPCTSVPAGLNKNGLPIGIQIIAAPHQDRLCFAVAKELENCFGGWQQP